MHKTGRVFTFRKSDNINKQTYEYLREQFINGIDDEETVHL